MDARHRVWTSSVLDPLLYVGLFLFLLLLISGLNSGCKLVYQLDTGYWEMGRPPASWLPFSVKAGPAYLAAAVALSVFLGAVIIRHALTRTPKRRILQSLAIVSGVIALIRCVPYFKLTEIQDVFLRTTAADSCGVVFGFWSICSLGLFENPEIEHTTAWWRHFLFVFGVFANLLGMLFFASVLSAGIGALIFLVAFILRLFFSRGKVPASSILKTIVLSLLIIGGTFSLLRFIYPDNPVTHKIASLYKWEETSKIWTEQLPARSGAAMTMFQDHMWCGVGVEGYGEFVGLTIKKDSGWKPFRQDRGAVRNDYVQLLAEYGLVGCGILLSTLVVLLAPVFYRSHLYLTLVTSKKMKGEYPFPPEAATGLAAVVFAGLAAGFGNPFRAPALVLSCIFVLSALPVFLPRKQTVAEYEE